MQMENEDSDSETEDIVENDKYLIFITGYKTYSPHQIGNDVIGAFSEIIRNGA